MVLPTIALLFQLNLSTMRFKTTWLQSSDSDATVPITVIVLQFLLLRTIIILSCPYVARFRRLTGHLLMPWLPQVLSLLCRYQKLLSCCREIWVQWCFLSDFCTLSVNSGTSILWFFDSSPSHHMTFDKFILTNYTLIHNSLYTYTTNGTPLVVTQYGKSYWVQILQVISHSPLCFISLSFLMQLLSVGKITNTGCNVLFTPTSCVVQDSTGLRLGRVIKLLDYISWSISIFLCLQLLLWSMVSSFKLYF